MGNATVRSSSASPKARTVATAAAPFWRRSASVSAFVQCACWAAWAAFPWWIMSIVMLGTDWPCAMALARPETVLWLSAT